MGVLAALTSAAAKFVVARTGGIDLTKLERVPDRLIWPLLREGVDPTPRLSRVRDADPVQRLTSFMGLDLWLITGYDEAREVLGNVHHSTDIRPFMGRSEAAASMTARSSATSCSMIPSIVPAPVDDRYPQNLRPYA